jgi:hypothetical protein
MKFSSKIIIALIITLILSAASISVWAAPSIRQGTVPNPPVVRHVARPAAPVVPFVPIIPVTGGTYNVTLLGGCDAVGGITRILDPEKEIGPANTGFKFLTDGVDVKLDKICSIEICYPYPTDYKDKEGNIFKWDANTKLWVVMDTKISGDPAQICVTDESISQGDYALLGK